MTAPRRPWPPLAIALAAQAGGGLTAFGTNQALDLGFPPLALLVAQGVIAALLGHGLGLARWWIPLQALLPPAAGLALWLAVPGWVWLLAFALLALVFWNSAGDRVPLYLTNRRTWAALADLLPEREGIEVIDLGSGLGGTVTALARARPDARILGLETAPVPYALSRLRLTVAGKANAAIVWRDLWKEDLSRFDVVYCFLSPAPMPALWEKARAEMRPGSLLISNSFEVPGHPADRVVKVDDSRRTRLHVWQV